MDILSKAKYTKAVLKETLRLNPGSVGIGRMAGPNTYVRGYHIPEGASFAIIIKCILLYY